MDVEHPAKGSAAERLRRHRDRRRNGRRSITVDLSEEEIAYFAHIRGPAAVELNDRNALSDGLRFFLDDAFARAFRRREGAVFEIRLYDNAIDQLVRMGFLEASGRQDRRAVLKAFTTVAERALFEGS